ncbi:GNAT family N-acetyltransferase [archaeon]|jgi:ribosomal protein S18 acetylase RimI-like enzyme|nr:GNAT family N-acetyltransferase [archaeon]MBT4373720.1 GNAT family N-acetyltransferase [archaeon]MBT4531774.1 GNAT family N-acetyltransferase [archaeon]MBT7001886.1 GNAT family N-acetyltransferase [archaeon]MBT7281871.1 GNAT family N-acetyltransferase [archaeon]
MVWRVCSGQDRNEVIGFLTEMDREISPPVSTFPGGLGGVVDLFLKKGKILIAEYKTKPVGLLGYCLGEPSTDYCDSSVGYIYLTILHPEYRGKPSISKELLKRVTKEMEIDGVKEVRFKAYKDNEYTTELYSKLAKPVREELNTQGKLCVLYGVDLKEWKERF